MRLFKTYSEKEVKRVRPLVNKINGLEDNLVLVKPTTKEMKDEDEATTKRNLLNYLKWID